MVGIKEVIIARIFETIKIFGLRMHGMAGTSAMGIVTKIIRGTMVYHTGFGIIECMNVRYDIVIFCWIPTYIRCNLMYWLDFKEHLLCQLTNYCTYKIQTVEAKP
jgi:hypothetical protein